MADDMADEIIVVHDPLHPLSPPGLVRAVVRGLAGAADAAAAVPAGPVTDTLKWVDHGEVVRDTADRERYRLIESPQAYRRPALLAALAALAHASDDELSGQEPDVLPRVVAASGGAPGARAVRGGAAPRRRRARPAARGGPGARRRGGRVGQVKRSRCAVSSRSATARSCG